MHSSLRSLDSVTPAFWAAASIEEEENEISNEKVGAVAEAGMEALWSVGWGAVSEPVKMI